MCYTLVSPSLLSPPSLWITLILLVPYESNWLTGIGLAFFFLNILLFVANCVLISLRFYWRPGSLIDSFNDQFESLFISSIVRSVLKF